MNKQEFLNSLRTALGGELSAAVVEENVRYYEEYINSEIRMGKSESEVLAMLGNPKLIARSIIDAQGSSGGRDDGTYSEENGSGRYGEAGTGTNGKSKVMVRKMPLWLIVILVVVAICVIFGALVMFVWWLAPFIVVVWLLGFVVKTLRGKK